MREKDIFIRRCLRAGVCIFLPIILVIFAGRTEKPDGNDHYELNGPAEEIYNRSMQIDYSVKEYAIDKIKYDAMTDKIYKDAYYRAISGRDMVRDSEERDVYLLELNVETFQEVELEYTKFYYMDFDGDGLPELIVDMMGGGLYILKYLPDEEIVEMVLGYERTTYFHLLGSGQLYYHLPTLANKDIWSYVIVDADGQSIR